MPILTFRISVPATTPAKNPVLHSLVSGASAIESVMIWSTSNNATIDKCGYRLFNHLGTCLIPDAGSHDNFSFGNGEDGWSPIPNVAEKIHMNNRVIEGPPYVLQMQLYNNDAAAILVAGVIVVVEPMAKLAEQAMLYEFLVGSKGAQDTSPKTRTNLETSIKEDKPVDVSKMFTKPVFEVKQK